MIIWSRNCYAHYNIPKLKLGKCCHIQSDVVVEYCVTMI